MKHRFVQGTIVAMRTNISGSQEAGKRRSQIPGAGDRRAAFTLIEILVVCAIISILAGMVLVGLQYGRKVGEATAAKEDIQMLSSRIDSFKNAFGDYPPSSLGDIKIKGNGINEGNESLFAFLLSKKRGGPFAVDLKEDHWTNTDADELKGTDVNILKKEIDWIRGNSKLLEYTDFWREPYIYINSHDYGKKFKYQLTDGTIFEVEARKNQTTGTYYAPTTFQLWSIGPDGVNQNGEGDDIVSWK
jgi:prepilin-type N-terminal cleavage/methylation domain-containing protein